MRLRAASVCLLHISETAIISEIAFHPAMVVCLWPGLAELIHRATEFVQVKSIQRYQHRSIIHLGILVARSGLLSLLGKSAKKLHDLALVVADD